MKFTLSWLKEHLETDADLNMITDTLTAIGLELEGVEDASQSLAAFTVAEILAAEKHPDADKLQVCRVKSDEGELQIVCGAPNARPGLKVALAKVGAIIPNGAFKIKKSKIRGVESCGMLCSSTELDIGSDAEGIMELPEAAEIGQPVAEVLGLNDPVIDIAITPNRGDCLGVYGIARDLAAAGLGTLKPLPETTFKAVGTAPINIELKTSHCPIFVGRVIKGVKNGPSPEWLQRRLTAIGLRPISALVDITNYFTFTYGRPLHVYDAAKLNGNIIVREAGKGEAFDALNDKSYTLSGGECVIADEKGMLGLGGVVGGVPSGVTEETTDVLLECAWFNPIHIAENGRKLGVESDARYRFERTVDPAFVEMGEQLAAQMILDLCGGEPCEAFVAGDAPVKEVSVPFDAAAINALGGIELSEAEQRDILERLGFRRHPERANATEGSMQPHDRSFANAQDDVLLVPTWRPDISQPADLAEEVLRIFGYDKVPSVALPKPASATANPLSAEQHRRESIRSRLTGRRMLEAHSYGFISEKEAVQFGVAANEQIRLLNPISTELSVMRPSLLPHMVSAAAKNHDRGQTQIALFEIGQTFTKDALHTQHFTVAGLRSGQQIAKAWHGEARAADSFDVKADAFAVLHSAGLDPQKVQMNQGAAPDYYHPGRSAALNLGPKKLLGYVGELHPALLKAMDAPKRMVAFEIFIDAIPPAKTKKGEALTRSDFQASTRDFAFITDQSLPADDLLKAIHGADKRLIQEVSLFDVYEGEHVGEGKKSLALSVTLQAADHTLSEEELNAASQAIIQQAQKLGAELRG